MRTRGAAKGCGTVRALVPVHLGHPAAVRPVRRGANLIYMQAAATGSDVASSDGVVTKNTQKIANNITELVGDTPLVSTIVGLCANDVT
jgi:hypothetical protein